MLSVTCLAGLFRRAYPAAGNCVGTTNMRHFLTMLFLCVGSGLALGQQAAVSVQPGWVFDTKSRCKVWSSNATQGLAMNWTGGCVDGMAEGSGTLQWVDRGKPSWRYEGDFEKGKMNGRGTFQWPDGQRYVGQFKDDQIAGKGVVSAPNGSRYEGDWDKGTFNGRGVLVPGDGTRYEGEFKDGRYNGEGVQTNADGSSFAGLWTNGLPNGEGTLTTAKGEKYKGAWSNGCFTDGRASAWYLRTAKDCKFQ